jgi:hypothetical protein
VVEEREEVVEEDLVLFGELLQNPARRGSGGGGRERLEEIVSDCNT